MKKLVVCVIITIVGVVLPKGAAHAVDESTNIPGGSGNIGSNVNIAIIAEETKIAWQWDAAAGRVKPTNFDSFKGYVFEEMSKDAHNTRHPFNRVRLMELANEKGVDGVFVKGGKMVQMKATDSTLSNARVRQIEGLKGLDELHYTDGEVWVTKGDKVLNSPRVKESPVSQERLRVASNATAHAGTLATLLMKGGMFGAVFGGTIEGIAQGVELNEKRLKGDRITLADWRKAGIAVVSESTYGGASGVAAVGAGVLLTTAAAPVWVVIVGTVVVGAWAYYGLKNGVKWVKSLF